MKTTENKVVTMARASMREAFTLVELLVVVAILGILGAVAVSSVTGHIEKTRVTAAKQAVDNLKGAITTYNISHKKLPSSLNQLIEAEGDDEPLIEGGEGALIDPWDNEYKLETKGKRFVVISSGPDCQFGTEDDIRSDKIDSNKRRQ